MGLPKNSNIFYQQKYSECVIHWKTWFGRLSGDSMISFCIFLVNDLTLEWMRMDCKNSRTSKMRWAHWISPISRFSDAIYAWSSWLLSSSMHQRLCSFFLILCHFKLGLARLFQFGEHPFTDWIDNPSAFEKLFFWDYIYFDVLVVYIPNGIHSKRYFYSNI